MALHDDKERADKVTQHEAIELSLAPNEQTVAPARSLSERLPSLWGLSHLTSPTESTAFSSFQSFSSSSKFSTAQSSSSSSRSRTNAKITSGQKKDSSLSLSGVADEETGQRQARKRHKQRNVKYAEAHDEIEYDVQVTEDEPSDLYMSFGGLPLATEKTRAAQFIQDFLFTDIMNHCEFLKWMQTLDKNDDLLLVHLLERIRTRESIDRMSIDPFYDDHKDLPRNPYHIARAYTELQRLHGHKFNIYELTYLNPTGSYIFASALALLAQIGLLAILFHYQLDEGFFGINPEVEKGDYSQLIVVAFISSIVFLKKGEHHWKSCHEFNALFREMGNSEAQSFLTINAFVNKFICVLVFAMNVWFVLRAENASEAVLDSLALFFILEIDDELVPDWDKERAEDAMAYCIHEYIMIKFSAPQLRVMLFTQDDRSIKYNYSGLREDSQPMSDEESLPPPDRLKYYSGQEKLYIEVEKIEHDGGTVAVYKAVRKVKGQEPYLTTSYKKISYTLRGTKANEFLHIIQRFKCMHNFHDIHQ